MNQTTKDLDTMLQFFAHHERGINDYLRDLAAYLPKKNKQEEGNADADSGYPPFVWYWTSLYKKLKEDGYLYEYGTAIVWTVDGRLAYYGTPRFFKTRPYAYKQFLEERDFWWQALKITAAFLNAVAILYLGWLGVKK